ncbi:hypothetical protein [Indioceanicola profundi]|uniref:hypothetical protein n=1 Tax=Indioceanicola profundi TaxID=2220096 RepID=UPI000E6AAE75|nr:hypothetical protein [Indioceanicola profundi]
MASGARGSEAQTTTDHETIRKWAEARNGRPASVKGTHKGDDGGILRIDFDEQEEGLEPITWDEFFKTFEDRELAFLYQDEIDGNKSRFFKLVSRKH